MELRPSEGAPAGFPFEEKMARHALGLNKDDARALRKAHLEEGDYVIHKKRLYLSTEAVAKLGRVLEKTRGSSIVRNGDPKESVPAEPAPIVALRVVRADLKNRRMILACVPEDELAHPKRPLRVRVKAQANFVPGMEIPAQLVAGYADLYDLARACPRRKGKW